MTQTAKIAVFVFTAALACVCVAYPQESPSLGDVARQTRQKKQESKDIQDSNTPRKTPKVLTDEDLPEHPSTPAASPDENNGSTVEPNGSEAGKLAPEQWKAQILAQKSVISRLQSDTERLNDSIQFAPGNCVAGCVQWNQHQEEKQRRVERMRRQLEEQKARLQKMQEAARQQGYGSSVYDP